MLFESEVEDLVKVYIICTKNVGLNFEAMAQVRFLNTKKTTKILEEKISYENLCGIKAIKAPMPMHHKFPNYSLLITFLFLKNFTCATVLVINPYLFYL